MTVDGENIAERLMTELQLMSGSRLLVGGSENTANITNGIMRNNFYGTIDKVRTHRSKSTARAFYYFIILCLRQQGPSRAHKPARNADRYNKTQTAKSILLVSLADSEGRWEAVAHLTWSKYLGRPEVIKGLYILLLSFLCLFFFKLHPSPRRPSLYSISAVWIIG